MLFSVIRSVGIFGGIDITVFRGDRLLILSLVGKVIMQLMKRDKSVKKDYIFID